MGLVTAEMVTYAMVVSLVAASVSSTRARQAESDPRALLATFLSAGADMRPASDPQGGR
jgi:hypothetical protein